MFQSIDLDGDGRADFHEFYTAAINHREILTQDNLDNIFKILDFNKSYSLEINDFQKMLPTNLNRKGIVRRKEKG